MAGHGLFGLKDPRISALLPFWRPVLAASEAAVHCLICLRHPDSVAHSLSRRDGMPPEHSHALWAAHTLGAIQGSSGLSRTFASYEALLREPETGIADLGRTLQLAPDQQERQRFITDFLDSSLCHHTAGPGTGPASQAEAAAGPWGALARDIHEVLCPAAGKTPTPDSPELARHMMYARGPQITKGYAKDVVAHCARVGVELGADIVKVPYTGDVESFSEVVAACCVPVVIAGGERMDSTRQILQMVSDSLNAGGAGISVGRNVFQHPNRVALVKALRAIVHENATVDQALKIVGE